MFPTATYIEVFKAPPMPFSPQERKPTSQAFFLKTMVGNNCGIHTPWIWHLAFFLWVPVVLGGGLLRFRWKGQPPDRSVAVPWDPLAGTQPKRSQIVGIHRKNSPKSQILKIPNPIFQGLKKPLKTLQTYHQKQVSYMHSFPKTQVHHLGYPKPRPCRWFPCHCPLYVAPCNDRAEIRWKVGTVRCRNWASPPQPGKPSKKAPRI